MALTKCPECNKDVSSHAASCPHCGFPLGGSAQTDRSQPDAETLDESSAASPSTKPKPGIGCSGCAIAYLTACALLLGIAAIWSAISDSAERWEAARTGTIWMLLGVTGMLYIIHIHYGGLGSCYKRIRSYLKPRKSIHPKQDEPKEDAGDWEEPRSERPQLNDAGAGSPTTGDTPQVSHIKPDRAGRLIGYYRQLSPDQQKQVQGCGGCLALVFGSVLVLVLIGSLLPGTPVLNDATKQVITALRGYWIGSDGYAYRIVYSPMDYPKGMVTKSTYIEILIVQYSSSSMLSQLTGNYQWLQTAVCEIQELDEDSDRLNVVLTGWGGLFASAVSPRPAGGYLGVVEGRNTNVLIPGFLSTVTSFTRLSQQEAQDLGLIK